MKHNGDSRRPEEIQAEIARTRGDMDATLTAIEQRLTPGQLVDQGLDYMRNSGAREFASNLGGSVKNNPLPVALMGISIAWLIATGNRKPSYLQEGDYGHHESTGPGMMQRASERMGSAKSSLSSTTQSARERVGQIGQGARERVGQIGQGTRERVGQLSDTARNQMERMRYQAERMRGNYDSMVREQPLALGAIGLAIGALLAAVAPRTRQEDQLMGEASDRLTEKAKEAGKEQMSKVQQVATAAKDAAMGEAEKQGMPKLGQEQQSKSTHEQGRSGQPQGMPGREQGTSKEQGRQGPQPGIPGASIAAGRPNVVEPARVTPAGGVSPKDPRLGTP